MSAICCECSCAIADNDREQCAWIGGAWICAACKQKLIALHEPCRCQKCGKDVSKEVDKARQGDYVCKSCRQKSGAEPVEILFEFMHRTEKTPDIKGYEIEKRLGIGGFGAVYLARHKKSGQRVAIKILLSRVAVDEGSRERFLREIEVMKDLRHEHIVPLLDNGSVGSAFYFIMEYCEGGSVDRLMAHRGGRLRLSEAVPIILQSLKGLDYAHSKNIVHRDLKPANILLKGQEGRWTAKIADMGLAKNFQRAGFSGPTMTGKAAGTPHFMPREQLIDFKHVKPVSDVWSMSATLYNMLTGQSPWDFPRGRDPFEVILSGSIVPIRKRDSVIPEKLAAVIDRALDNNIKNRYQTADEFRRALEKV